VTPTPDMVTQCIFAAPMILLYLLSILVAHVFGKHREARPERRAHDGRRSSPIFRPRRDAGGLCHGVGGSGDMDDAVGLRLGPGRERRRATARGRPGRAGAPGEGRAGSVALRVGGLSAIAKRARHGGAAWVLEASTSGGRRVVRALLSAVRLREAGVSTRASGGGWRRVPDRSTPGARHEMIPPYQPQTALLAVGRLQRCAVLATRVGRSKQA